MKILIVTPYFHPSIGGVQNYVLNIARLLKKEYKHKIVIITSGDKRGQVEKSVFEDMTVYRLPYDIKLSNTPIGFSWKQQIKDIITDEKPDVINAHTPVPFMADMAARASGPITFTLTYHNDLAKSSLLGNCLAKAFYILFSKRTMRRSDRIIATSSYYVATSPYLQKYKEKVEIVSPGVDFSRFNTKVEKTLLKSKYPDKKIVLFVGSMEKTHTHKGVDVLIKAVAQAKKVIPNIQLVVVGGGDAIPMYMQLAKDLEVTDVIDFPGFIDDQVLPEYYAGSDVFVLPSTNEAEGFGMVLAEAIACGTFVIGTKVGGIPFVIDDETAGLIVEPNNVKSLTDAIQITLLDRKNLIATLNKKTQKAASRFSWSQSVTQTDSILRRASGTSAQTVNKQHLRSTNRIAIYYDIMQHKGGAERSIIILANQLGADIITSGYNPDIDKWMHIEGKVIDLGNFSYRFNKSIGYTIEAPLRFWIYCRKYNYDVNIFSGLSSIFGAKPGRNNIWFCHTPNRLLYDLSDYNLEHSRLARKVALSIYKVIMRPIDQKVIKDNFSKIIVNSQTVQKRVHTYYHMNSQVIYPPVETHKYQCKNFDNYIITVGNLRPEKRIALLLSAFSKMPEQKLIVVGDGPLGDALAKELSTNVQLLRRVNDEELKDLYANCKAAIYVPVNEDFGLVPIEAMASGKMCIAANEGGCRETVIEAKTGFLISPDEESIINAVRHLSTECVLKHKQDCLLRAREFDVATYIQKWREVLDA